MRPEGRAAALGLALLGAAPPPPPPPLEGRFWPEDRFCPPPAFAAFPTAPLAAPASAAGHISWLCPPS